GARSRLPASPSGRSPKVQNQTWSQNRDTDKKGYDRGIARSITFDHHSSQTVYSREARDRHSRVEASLVHRGDDRQNQKWGQYAEWNANEDQHFDRGDEDHREGHAGTRRTLPGSKPYHGRHRARVRPAP